MKILNKAISALHTLEMWRSGYAIFNAKMEVYLEHGELNQAMFCKRVSLRYKARSIVEHDREINCKNKINCSGVK